MPIRQIAYYDLDDLRQNQKNIVSFQTDAGVTIDCLGDGIHVYSRKMSDLISLLFRQFIGIMSKSRKRKIEIDH
jgi:hypothetical protein